MLIPRTLWSSSQKYWLKNEQNCESVKYSFSMKTIFTSTNKHVSYL
jgi:hypothetical protein